MSFGLKLVQGNLKITNGKFEIVENEEKLVQDCLKAIITTTGDNPFHPTYGSLIGKNSIGQIFDPEFQAQSVENYIRNSLEMLQKSQRESSLFQMLTPEEILTSIQQIKVERNQIDPRYLQIYVSILNGKLNIQTFQLDIRL